MLSLVLLSFFAVLSFSGLAFAAAPTAAPTDVSISQVTGTGALVSWTKSVDTTNTVGYNIYVDSVLKRSVGDVSSSTISGLTQETSYSVTVTARDADGLESSPSTAVSLLTTASAISINFNMAEMFTYSQMILDVMMPVLYITLGIALGFIVIRALKSAFN